jgi:predicted RND superfamily exporter protein
LGCAAALAERHPAEPDVGGAGGADDRDRNRFSVILAGRFHEERGAGRGVEAALRSTYARTGAAVLASVATAIIGFAVLIASDIQMLRDFGFITVIDLAAALLGVMIVLPATLVWSEGR